MMQEKACEKSERIKTKIINKFMLFFNREAIWSSGLKNIEIVGNQILKAI